MTTICFLENGTSGGGSFESLRLLLTHLDRVRYAAIVACTNPTPVRVPCATLGVPVVDLRDPRYSVTASLWTRRRAAAIALAGSIMPHAAVACETIAHRPAVRTLTQALRAHHVAVLHTNNNPVRDAYGIAAAHALGIPIVAHLRSVRVGSVPPALARWLGHTVTHAIANSAHAKDWWMDTLGFPEDRVTVIPNPAARDPVAPFDARATWGIPPDAPLVVCAANFTVGKGHGLLLEAFARVRSEMPTAHLLCVGDGPLRADAEARVATLGIVGAVRFAGYLPNARAVIAGCDALAVPSETETFGRVVVEGMGVGTPVVATRVGGIPELLRDGENGLLVPPDDPGALSDALVRVLRDRVLARALRVGGYATIATGAFDPATHAARVAAVYDDVLARTLA